MIANRVSHALRSSRLVAHYGLARHASSRRKSSADGQELSAASSLMDFVIKGGGSASDKLAIAKGEYGGLGLRAAEDIDVSERLIFLPESSTLSYNSNQRKLMNLIKAVPEELWGVKVALALLVERVRGPGSSFHPYIENLPIGFTVPMFWPRDAIAQLEYPPVVEQIKKRGVFLYEFSSKRLQSLAVDEDPFDGIKVDTNALGWGLAAVSSRAFRTRGPSEPASLLPLIDLANHSFEPNAEVKVEERGGIKGVSVLMKKRVNKGEEITLSYGPLTNDFLLLDYGFMIPDNPYDRVQLRWSHGLFQTGAMIAGLEESSALADWQQRLLSQLGLEGLSANTEVCLGGSANGGVDPRLLAGVRIIMAGAENALQGRDLKSLGVLEEPLGIKTETRALKAISGVAALSLSNFSTTLLEDTQALSKGVCPTPSSPGSPPSSAPTLPLSDEVSLAVRFRIEKKKIMSKTIQTLGAQLEKLSKEKEGKKDHPSRPASRKGFGGSKK